MLLVRQVHNSVSHLLLAQDLKLLAPTYPLAYLGRRHEISRVHKLATTTSPAPPTPTPPSPPQLTLKTKEAVDWRWRRRHMSRESEKSIRPDNCAQKKVADWRSWWG